MEKTFEEIIRDAQNSYSQKLDSMQIESESDLILYCSYAGRLYSLGLEEYIPKADDLLYNSSFKNEVERIFLDRIDQGIEDLQDGRTGKEVGVSLIELQDMYSFLKHTSYPFSRQVFQNFQQWIDEGRYANVNVDTIAYINDFLEANPLDPSDVLDLLSEPVTQEIAELEYLQSGIRYTECQPKEVNGGWEFSDAGYSLRLEFKPPTENAICFELYEPLSGDKVPVEGVTIRQDVIPAFQNSKSPLNWSINYSYFLGLDLSKRKQEPLTIRLPMGGVCKIPVPIATSSDDVLGSITEDIVAQSTDVPIASSSDHRVTRVRLFDSSIRTVAAADGKKADFFEYAVEGTNATLVFTVDYSSKRVIVNVCQNGNRDLFSNELDGFQVYSCDNNTLLGEIQNAFAELKSSQFDGFVELKDANGKVQQLEARQ